MALLGGSSQSYSQQQARFNELGNSLSERREYLLREKG